MEQFLIDSNVLSGYLSNAYTEQAMDFLAAVIDQKPRISVITEIEALSWKHTDKQKEELIRQFVSNSEIVPLSKDVVRVCIKIRRSKSVKTPDAIIAATAIVHDLTLITADRGFETISDLKQLHPIDTSSR